MIVRAVTLPPAQTPRPRRTSSFVKVLPPPSPLPTRRTLSSISSYVPAPPRVTLPSIEVQLDDDEAITAAHPSPVPHKPSADRETLPEVIIPRAPRMPSEMSNVIPLRPVPPRPMDVPVAPQSVPYAPAVSSQMASVLVRDLEADRAALRAEAIQIVREAVARVEGARPPTDSGAGLRWLVTGILTGIFGAYLIFAAATRQSPRVDANEVAKAVIAQQAQQAHAQPPAPPAAQPTPPPAAHAPAVASNPIPVIPSMDVENLPKHPSARTHAWHPAPRPAARRAAPPPPAAATPADEPSADDALGPVLATK